MTPEERAKRISATFEEWGKQTRRELDDAKQSMSEQEYKNFHRHTVDDLLRRMEELLGIA